MPVGRNSHVSNIILREVGQEILLKEFRELVLSQRTNQSKSWTRVAKMLAGCRGCWERPGQVKGSVSSGSTMQISGHFVWQATTVFCIYAKAGRTLSTHTAPVRAQSRWNGDTRWVTPICTQTAGPDFHFIQTDTQTQLIKRDPHQLSEVKHGAARG